MTSINWVILRDQLVERFNLDELRDMCFVLQVDYEKIPGHTNIAFARELVLFMKRRERLMELTEAAQSLRPTANWGSVYMAPAPIESGEQPAFGVVPYKGLQYFNQEDSELFFGRSAWITRLLEAIQTRRFLALVGSSGSGKSSLIRAGLLPALRERASPATIEQPYGWHPICLVTPKEHPLRELANGLISTTRSMVSADTLVAEMRLASNGLRLWLSEVMSQSLPEGWMLLVVDQFEELFTSCQDEAERTAFVANLMASVDDATENRLKILIALRADYYEHCGGYEKLPDALASHQLYLQAMTKEDLRTAIQDPAALHDWRLEAGLVEHLLSEVGSAPGRLPLLSHTLLESWQRRRGRLITFEGYFESGGVSGAVSETAERIFATLDEDQQIIARDVMLRLTVINSNINDIRKDLPYARRRASFTELVPHDQDQRKVKAVLDSFANARLLVLGKETVEVAHEALIREWYRLNDWLEEEKRGLGIWRSISLNSKEWEQSDNSVDYLFRGQRLKQALEWAEENQERLNSLEQRFLAKSRLERLSSVVSGYLDLPRPESELNLRRQITLWVDLLSNLDRLEEAIEELLKSDLSVHSSLQDDLSIKPINILWSDQIAPLFKRFEYHIDSAAQLGLTEYLEWATLEDVAWEDTGLDMEDGEVETETRLEALLTSILSQKNELAAAAMTGRISASWKRDLAALYAQTRTVHRYAASGQTFFLRSESLF